MRTITKMENKRKPILRHETRKEKIDKKRKEKKRKEKLNKERKNKKKKRKVTYSPECRRLPRPGGTAPAESSTSTASAWGLWTQG